MTHIELDREGIDQALPRVLAGLQKYGWLQTELRRRDVSRDREYQKRFNGFYRVRRNAQWQQAFYTMLEWQVDASIVRGCSSRAPPQNGSG